MITYEQCYTLSLAHGMYTTNVSRFPSPYSLEILRECSPKPEAWHKLICFVYPAWTLMLCFNNWAHVLFSTPSLVPFPLTFFLFHSCGHALIALNCLFPYLDWTSACPFPVLSQAGLLSWGRCQRFLQLTFNLKKEEKKTRQKERKGSGKEKEGFGVWGFSNLKLRNCCLWHRICGCWPSLGENILTVSLMVDCFRNPGSMHASSVMEYSPFASGVNGDLSRSVAITLNHGWTWVRSSCC